MIDGGDELFFVTTIAAEDGLRALLSPESPVDERHPVTSDQHGHENQSPADDGFDG